MRGVSYSHKYDCNGNDYVILQFSRDVEIQVSVDQLVFLLNESKPFYYDHSNQYPYYTYNENKITILEYLHKCRGLVVTFLDNNRYNLRKTNIVMNHEKYKEVEKRYSTALFIHSHINSKGKDALINKNPIWRVKDNEYIMYCETDGYIILDDKSYSIIKDKDITFFMCANNYVAGRYNGKQYYIHQIIMDCYGHGKGTYVLSVDHIDRNPLNNRYDNLRIVKHTEQQDNRKGILKGTKRERKKSARPLPDGITQDMMEKYVVYYKECYNKNKDLYREFFKVEKHPKLKKAWCSSKSGSFSILEKLNNVNEVVRNLEKDIYPEEGSKLSASKSNSTNHLHIPKYISIRTVRGKPCIIYEKRLPKTSQNQSIFNIKYTIPSIPKNNDELNIYLKEIEIKGIDKYGEKWPGLICDRK